MPKKYHLSSGGLKIEQFDPVKVDIRLISQSLIVRHHLRKIPVVIGIELVL